MGDRVGSIGVTAIVKALRVALVLVLRWLLLLLHLVRRKVTGGMWAIGGEFLGSRVVSLIRERGDGLGRELVRPEPGGRRRGGIDASPRRKLRMLVERRAGRVLGAILLRGRRAVHHAGTGVVVILERQTGHSLGDGAHCKRKQTNKQTNKQTKHQLKLELPTPSTVTCTKRKRVDNGDNGDSKGAAGPPPPPPQGLSQEGVTPFSQEFG